MKHIKNALSLFVEMWLDGLRGRLVLLVVAFNGLVVAIIVAAVATAIVEAFSR